MPNEKASPRTRYMAAAVGLVAVTDPAMPQGSMYAAASVGFRVLEAALYNSASNTKRIQIKRVSTVGTRGAAITSAKMDPDSVAASCAAYLSHTSTVTIGEAMHMMPSVTAIGTGLMYGWHDIAIEVPPGTTNGLGFLLSAGGGAGDCHWMWEE